MFTYLEDKDIPNTSNLIEGGINSLVRTLLKCHRGMTMKHRKLLVELLV
jgi:hypothetical protein